MKLRTMLLLLFFVSHNARADYSVEALMSECDQYKKEFRITYISGANELGSIRKEKAEFKSEDICYIDGIKFVLEQSFSNKGKAYRYINATIYKDNIQIVSKDINTSNNIDEIIAQIIVGTEYSEPKIIYGNGFYYSN